MKLPDKEAPDSMKSRSGHKAMKPWEETLLHSNLLVAEEVFEHLVSDLLVCLSELKDVPQLLRAALEIDPDRFALVELGVREVAKLGRQIEKAKATTLGNNPGAAL